MGNRATPARAERHRHEALRRGARRDLRAAQGLQDDLRSGAIGRREHLGACRARSSADSPIVRDVLDFIAGARQASFHRAAAARWRRRATMTTTEQIRPPPLRSGRQDRHRRRKRQAAGRPRRKPRGARPHALRRDGAGRGERRAWLPSSMKTWRSRISPASVRCSSGAASRTPCCAGGIGRAAQAAAAQAQPGAAAAPAARARRRWPGRRRRACACSSARIEALGVKVVGAHQIAPDLLASEGQMTGVAPQKSDWRDIEAALPPPRARSARSTSGRRRWRSAAAPSRSKASRAPTACSNG